MTDPLKVLRSPLLPVDPDPEFAATLRARLQRALSLPRGASMSTTSAATTTSAPLSASTRITPYLAVADARRALGWYAEAFGARPHGEPIVMPDGRIGHAEIEFGGARLMLSDAHPDIGVVAPQPGQGASVTLHVEIADVDAATARAVEAGAALDRPPVDSPYGRSAVLRDPFGHRWMLMTPAPPSTPAGEVVRPGDVGYVSLWVPDVERAARFYGSVLGWLYPPGNQQSRMVSGVTPLHGLVELSAVPPIFAGQRHPTLFRSHAVDDIYAAVRAVRAAGGQADDPAETPYGRTAGCLDPDGAPFSVHQGSGDEPRGPVNGARQGDISYLTLQAVDGTRARDFYSAVFGWQFTPGHSPEGWEPRDVVPMTGLHGGHERATAVPMYRVDDITAAVGRVRAGGGTATDPQAQPYGWMSECIDDQGTHFYLGQH